MVWSSNASRADMVFGTPDALAKEISDMRKGKKQIEEMSRFDRELVGADRNKHLVIPLGAGTHSFRRIAAMLNQLAADLDMLSRNMALTPRQAVLDARDAIDTANRQMREMIGKGQSLKGQAKRYNKDDA